MSDTKAQVKNNRRQICLYWVHIRPQVKIINHHKCYQLAQQNDHNSIEVSRACNNNNQHHLNWKESFNKPLLFTETMTMDQEEDLVLKKYD